MGKLITSKRQLSHFEEYGCPIEEYIEETRYAGVKTKSGCEDTILGQILPPRGGVSNHFSENSSDLGHFILASRR